MALSYILDGRMPSQDVTQRIRDITTTFAIKHVSPGIQATPKLNKIIQVFTAAFVQPYEDDAQASVGVVSNRLKIPVHAITEINVPIHCLISLIPSWFTSVVNIRRGTSPIVVGLIESLGGISGFGLASLEYWDDANFYTLDICCYPHLKAFHWNIDNDSWRIDRNLKNPLKYWPMLRDENSAYAKSQLVHFVPEQQPRVSHPIRDNAEHISQTTRMIIYLQGLTIFDYGIGLPQSPHERLSLSKLRSHFNGKVSADEDHSACGSSTASQRDSSIAQDNARSPNEAARELPPGEEQSNRTLTSEELLQANKAEKKREAQRQRRMKKRLLKSDSGIEELSPADARELMGQEQEQEPEPP